VIQQIVHPTGGDSPGGDAHAQSLGERQDRSQPEAVIHRLKDDDRPDRRRYVVDDPLRL